MQGIELIERLKTCLTDTQILLYAADDYMCPPTQYPALIVINSGYSQGSGQHYISFHIDKNKRVNYFDSFGLPPYSCLRQFWKRHRYTLIGFNKRLVQDPASDKCGFYVIAFGVCVANNFTRWTELLTDNYPINDKVIVAFVKWLTK